MEIVLTELD